MSGPHRTSSTESADSIRKRVGKACDRCRLKKSKCDGSSPCTRCKADNAICVFGERKKSHDKVYPKGYVEMLEQQQGQLVAGLQETYRRLFKAQAWPGSRLAEHNGNPLTHDILARLELLEPKQDGSGEMEVFEEDCKKLQQRLVSDGAPFVGRRGSFSSDSDHDASHRHARTSSQSSFQGSPAPSQAQPVFEQGWSFQSSPSPIVLSPPPKMQRARLSSIKPSPLSAEPVVNDDFLEPSWQDVGNSDFAQGFLRNNFAHQTTHETLHTMMDTYAQSIDASMDTDNGTMGFNPQEFANQMPQFGMFNTQDWLNDPTAMDLDYSKFVQVPA